MSILYDALSDASVFAAQVGSPSIAPLDALPYASTDRQIVQGFQESSSSLRARLIQWLDRWPYSGRATGVLLFARAWILPQLPHMVVVTNSGTWWSYADGTDPMPAGRQTVTPALVQQSGTGGVQAWNWDGQTTHWWRSWLIIWSTDTAWVAGGTIYGASIAWGDKTQSWGFADPSSVLTGLSAIVNLVKRAGNWYPYVIVAFDDTTFQPTSTGVAAPDGNYGHWSKIVNGQYVRARTINSARYIGVAP